MASSIKVADTQVRGQAPINLNDTIVQRTKFPTLVLDGHWLNKGIATLFNDGKKANICLSGDRISSTVSGGPLGNDEYELHNAHFHWGENDCRGAEHTINNIWFSMECHLVHWNKKYLTFEECLKHQDGLCVLAYLFLVQSGFCKQNKFQQITENLKYIRNPGSERKIPANSLSWVRIAFNCSSYYTYHGSYNVDSHPEIVTWIVFPTIIPIQSCQLNEFRKLKNKNGEFIKSNWRDIQPLRERQVFLAIS